MEFHLSEILANAWLTKFLSIEAAYPCVSY